MGQSAAQEKKRYILPPKDQNIFDLAENAGLTGDQMEAVMAAVRAGKYQEAYALLAKSGNKTNYGK